MLQPHEFRQTKEGVGQTTGAVACINGRSDHAWENLFLFESNPRRHPARQRAGNIFQSLAKTLVGLHMGNIQKRLLQIASGIHQHVKLVEEGIEVRQLRLICPQHMIEFIHETHTDAPFRLASSFDKSSSGSIRERSSLRETVPSAT